MAAVVQALASGKKRMLAQGVSSAVWAAPDIDYGKETAVPVRHLYLELAKARDWRGFVLYSLVCLMYMVLQQTRIDSIFSRGTYSAYQDAAARASATAQGR